MFKSWNVNKYLWLFPWSRLVLLKWTTLITEYLLRLWWLSHWCSKQRNRSAGLPCLELLLLWLPWWKWSRHHKYSCDFWVPLTDQASWCIKSCHQAISEGLLMCNKQLYVCLENVCFVRNNSAGTICYAKVRVLFFGSNRNLHISCSASSGNANADRGNCSTAGCAGEKQAICRHYIVPTPVNFEV